MQNFTSRIASLSVPVLLGALAVLGCSLPTAEDPTPAVTSTVPDDSDTVIAINQPITAKFNKQMDPATITTANFTVASDTGSVTGTVTYDDANRKAIFTPSADLEYLTTYTATITTGVTDKALGSEKGKSPKGEKVWHFKTSGMGPAAVVLGTAGNFVILAKTKISTVPSSAITGNIGVSPAARSYMTGFSETMDASNVFATSAQVTGKLYAADMTAPTPSNMTTAISDMQTAYTDAAGRPTPDKTNLGAGNIGGLVLAPGLYVWGTTVVLPTNVTIAGGANCRWIFQISGDLTVSSAVKVILSGGAQAENIVWQVAGIATLGTTSQFQGIILSKTQIIVQTGATLHGRALAQTQVTLDKAVITSP